MFPQSTFMTQSAEPVGDERCENRYPTATTITVSTPALGMFRAALVDLSAHGAHLRAPIEWLVNTPILLEIEPTRLLSAKVIWSRDPDAGIAFDDPLNPILLRNLVVLSWAARGA